MNSNKDIKTINKKYIIVLIDGAADYPLAELGNKTPLQAAKKPYIDRMASSGVVGIVKTIPDGIAPGSDTANLSILGYDPIKYSTGRSSLEAVSIGVQLEDDDIIFRCNLVTLSGEPEYKDRTMVDYSAGEITTDEARILINAIAEKLGSETLKFYPGISYRHVLVLKDGNATGKDDPEEETYMLTPPHDISGRKIGNYLPGGKKGQMVLDLMEKSTTVLKEHHINKKRIKVGKRPANSIWLWAKATKPSLDSFYEKYGLKGSVISAVDLVKGIGICAGLNAVNVKGATGNINTNYKGKALAALSELKEGRDFVYIHIEAPDECGHQGNIADKIRSIELIDSEVIGRIKEELDLLNMDYSMLILPDHPTPISLRTHTSDAVPFLIYDSSKDNSKNKIVNKNSNSTIPGSTGSITGCVSKVEKTSSMFDEFCPRSSGIYIGEGPKLMDYFLKR